VEPIVIGKPEPLLFGMALARLGCAPEACLMIGDRPGTDILGAARLGMATALVRTGRFAVGYPWPTGLPPADWDVGSLTELLAELRAAYPGAF
jgi:ribonucleotide monophosphatase NagD (HAD superfamily)